MNTNTAMITYNPFNGCVPPEIVILFCFLTVITMYSLMKNTNTETVADSYSALRIKIPTPVDSPVATPSPPPRKLIPPPAPARPKKVHTSLDVELGDQVLSYVRYRPGVNVHDILRALKMRDPLLTKNDINSRLYSLLYRKLVTKNDDSGGAPNWFPVR